MSDPDSAGKTRDKVAELTGTSSGYVSDAKRIVEKDASMLNRLRDGYGASDVFTAWGLAMMGTQASS